MNDKIRIKGGTMLNNYFRGYSTLRILFLIMYYLGLKEKLTLTQIMYLVKYKNKTLVRELLKMLQDMGDVQIAIEGKKKKYCLTDKGKSFLDSHLGFIVSYFKM